MNLKKIEVYGFKSFADKLEMKFDKPITAIVAVSYTHLTLPTIA